jgi:hypothetical protein
MGAPNKPGFSPDDSSVVFLQSGAGSLTQHLAAIDIASGAVSEMAQAPTGVGEEGSISAEEKLRRERARQLHTGTTSPPGGREVIVTPTHPCMCTSLVILHRKYTGDA